MKQSLPNFFIIGAPKCGTTSLQYYLEQHHDVFFAPKELHFFGEDLKIKNHSPKPRDSKPGTVTEEKVLAGKLLGGSKFEFRRGTTAA